MTLLHGYPSSSHDWAKIAPQLAQRRLLLMPDFLGFGASDKPADHDYSLHEQADLVEALWAQEGITDTALVAHDYAVSVAQELLARRAEGRLAVDLARVTLMNGGIYPDLHRPSRPGGAARPRAGPQDRPARHRGAVLGAAPDLRRGLRRRRRQRGDVDRHSRDGGPADRAPLIRLHRRPRDARASAGRRRWRPRTCRWPSSGGCSTPSPARTWPSGSPSACRRRRWRARRRRALADARGPERVLAALARRRDKP